MLLLSTFEYPFVALIWNWGRLETGVAIVDGKQCVTSVRGILDYIRLGKGTNEVDYVGRAYSCVFTNVETLGLLIQFGSPNFQKFDFNTILLVGANVQTFNFGTWPRFASCY